MKLKRICIYVCLCVRASCVKIIKEFPWCKVSLMQELGIELTRMVCECNWPSTLSVDVWVQSKEGSKMAGSRSDSVRILIVSSKIITSLSYLKITLINPSMVSWNLGTTSRQILSCFIEDSQWLFIEYKQRYWFKLGNLIISLSG